MRDSLKKLGEDYGLTPEGVRHAIERETVLNTTNDALSKEQYRSIEKQWK